MSVSKSVCPVPLEQQPVHEYQSLQDSCFSRWAILDQSAFVRRTFIWWAVASVLSAPVATSAFPWPKFPLLCVLTDTAGATGLLLLVLIRLYLGWAYVCDRLVSESIFYEETGWYDGQTWVKPEVELAHEQLIATYEVRPFLRRLRWCMALLSGGLALNILFCLVMAP